MERISENVTKKLGPKTMYRRDHLEDLSVDERIL
jgi:hypothetical protein